MKYLITLIILLLSACAKKENTSIQFNKLHLVIQNEVVSLNQLQLTSKVDVSPKDFISLKKNSHLKKYLSTKFEFMCNDDKLTRNQIKFNSIPSKIYFNDFINEHAIKKSLNHPLVCSLRISFLKAEQVKYSSFIENLYINFEPQKSDGFVPKIFQTNDDIFLYGGIDDSKFKDLYCENLHYSFNEKQRLSQEQLIKSFISMTEPNKLQRCRYVDQKNNISQLFFIKLSLPEGGIQQVVRSQKSGSKSILENKILGYINIKNYEDYPIKIKIPKWADEGLILAEHSLQLYIQFPVLFRPIKYFDEDERYYFLNIAANSIRKINLKTELKIPKNDTRCITDFLLSLPTKVDLYAFNLDNIPNIEIKYDDQWLPWSSGLVQSTLGESMTVNTNDSSKISMIDFSNALKRIKKYKFCK